MKTIWIIDHYSSEPKYGGISRQYDFANELARRGHRVVILASSYSHFTHSYLSEKEVYVSEISKHVHYVYLHTTQYSQNGGIGRMKSMISFYLQVMRYTNMIAEKYGRPDAVTGCSVHPFAWAAAYHAAKKFKIRFCIEVRDLWPRIWVAAGEKKKYSPMVLFFGMLERWAYKHADKIIYSMVHGDRYICDEVGIAREKTLCIGQPMDCERFDGNAEKNFHMLPEEIRAFMKDSFICAFAGYYMTYEGVYVMLDAAKVLKKRGIPVKMVFVGSGQETEGMREYARENNLEQVLIWDRISKEAIPALLKHSDVCMAHLAEKGKEDAYKYGVSKNKVNEYLYSGACTLYGFTDKEDAVAVSGAGYVFEPYNALELADKIQKVYGMKQEERDRFGENGRNYIREHHSVQVLTDKMEKVLLGG